MATDSVQFFFAVLQEDRKAVVSKRLDWFGEKDQIVSFLDHILKDVIESTPQVSTSQTAPFRLVEALH